MCLEEIRELCQRYVEDPDCVYKLCMNKWLVVLRKNKNTVTNENRKYVVDFKHAKFRASVLDVVFIVNVNDLSDTPSSVINCRDECDTYYTVGCIVEPHYFDVDWMSYVLEEFIILEQLKQHIIMKEAIHSTILIRIEICICSGIRTVCF
jgi:hypothetical protein